MDKLLVSRDDVHKAYELLGLGPSLFHKTYRLEVWSEVVRATRFLSDEAGNLIVGADNKPLFEITEVAIRESDDPELNQPS